WGIKGKVKIAGFNVGIYINLECDALLTAALAPPLILLCTSFILGSDGHLLIDQYGGASPFPTTETEVDAEGGGLPALDAQPEASLPRVNGVVEEMTIQTVADPAAPEIDQSFTVSASTGSLLVALGWA